MDGSGAGAPVYPLSLVGEGERVRIMSLPAQGRARSAT